MDSQPLDAPLPLPQLLGRVEVIGRGLILGPVLALASQQADVANRRSDDRVRRSGPQSGRLIQVAEADAIVHQGSQSLIECPTGVAHLRRQREFMKRAAQLDDEVPVRLGELEGPGKTHQQASELPGVLQRPKALFELADDGRLQRALMRELAAEHGREQEARMLRYLADPQPGKLRPQGPVKRSVDFHQVQMLREILQRMKTTGLDGRIDDRIPVRMRPAGYAAAKSALHGTTLLVSPYLRLLFYVDSLLTSIKIFFGKETWEG